ncbi:bifunctional folylpolyglutamate synthase/dihydrofolate synthase [Alteribacillus bidgolensis]|uniref:tetrahydrofolate synthase n=1 Tax=Alteribacillus bidgolensis TaxID=930129 RepID=A0A1G8H7S4_9BACI|nr:Mur ligase family protein [Alteribacillus bidgolensis]SDI02707.1 dihydrofolate synthase / folylpolyglutamate synthase [Alteribacillus bidgolensis]
MKIHTQKEAEDLIYASYLRAINNITENSDKKVKKPELTRRLLDYAGSPDKGEKYILVTGSKGKGSTSRFISSLLSHLGFKVGLFTSPHLVNFNERIRIDGKTIPEDDFIRISNKIKNGFDAIEKKLPADQYQGPIGIALAMAVIYFKENKTDINVIECGRGGKFDDANVLDNNWAVITPIMKEHVHQLGPDMSDIVLHKLGIIKSSTNHVYINKQRKDVFPIIENLLKNKDGISYYNKHFRTENIFIKENGTSFDVHTTNGRYKNLTVPLLGEFQAVNASAAVKVCEDIIGKAIDDGILKKCMENIKWPGRCEVVKKEPTIILDGAINESSANYIKEVIHVINKSGEKNIISIVGVPKDKDYHGVIRVLSDVSQQLWITKPDITHLTFPTDALEYAQNILPDSKEFAYLKDALDYAQTSTETDIILVVGTQTFIGNAKRCLGHSLLDIGK